jgi:hypothetical protein
MSQAPLFDNVQGIQVRRLSTCLRKGKFDLMLLLLVELPGQFFHNLLRSILPVRCTSLCPSTTDFSNSTDTCIAETRRRGTRGNPSAPSATPRFRVQFPPSVVLFSVSALATLIAVVRHPATEDGASGPLLLLTNLRCYPAVNTQNLKTWKIRKVPVPIRRIEPSLERNASQVFRLLAYINP